jgi:hypothetical protein
MRHLSPQSVMDNFLASVIRRAWHPAGAQESGTVPGSRQMGLREAYRLWSREPCWWPHSGHATPRKTGRRCKTSSDILRGQTASAQVARNRDTVYGSADQVADSGRSRSRRRLRRRWPGVSAGLSLSRGPPGARRATLAVHTDQRDSHATQAGAAKGHLPRLRLSRSRHCVQVAPCGRVACDRLRRT